jgi:protein-L-isoaspartate(D-aspartate) O-methyltransferase
LTSIILLLFWLTQLWLPGCSLSNQDISVIEEKFQLERQQMVENQIQARGIHNQRVLQALQKVPRHRFLPPSLSHLAYTDSPLSIGYEQTISQPYIVAYMSEAAQISPQDKVLEIGTGSGYQTAILAELAKEVYTIEIVPELAKKARHTLQELGYSNIHVRMGNGYQGWEQYSPYDAIIVTAAPAHIPEALIEQLEIKGKMVIPVGTLYQELKVFIKTEKGLIEQKKIPVQFVPMTGKVKSE